MDIILNLGMAFSNELFETSFNMIDSMNGFLLNLSTIAALGVAFLGYRIFAK